jgi:hypothetical protein
MDGSIDLTEALNGMATYKDRTISASFLLTEGTYNDRIALIQNIRNLLHGKKVKIIEPDDTSHYFSGRITVKSENNILAYSTITIEAICDPWRYCNTETVVAITSTSNAKTYSIKNTGTKTVCPTITTTSTITISYNSKSKSLAAGNYKLTDLKIPQGGINIQISGTGTIKFFYTEAIL